MTAGAVTAGPGSWWIFGYGSLIWRPDFDFVERRVGRVNGWMRRFWQASTDHRGVPGAPGRVATLVPAGGETCVGVAYRVEAAAGDCVLANLDWREKGGYARHQIEVTCGGADDLQALIYIATAENPEYCGPESVSQTAATVSRSVGPSGTNAEYLFELARALGELGEREAYMTELVDAVRAANPRRDTVSRG